MLPQQTYTPFLSSFPHHLPSLLSSLVTLALCQCHPVTGVCKLVVVVSQGCDLADFQHDTGEPHSGEPHCPLLAHPGLSRDHSSLPSTSARCWLSHGALCVSTIVQCVLVGRPPGVGGRERGDGFNPSPHRARRWASVHGVSLGQLCRILIVHASGAHGAWLCDIVHNTDPICVECDHVFTHPSLCISVVNGISSLHVTEWRGSSLLFPFLTAMYTPL
ncbi:hypothetical protein DFH06DRAFT_1472935 [Mycena polygramma]|nr:hypothetical protein DFH06DRAFT_1472935 [Mycena polygramma]